MKAVLVLVPLASGRWHAVIEVSDQVYSCGIYGSQPLALAGAANYAAGIPSVTEIEVSTRPDGGAR
jgi:hypothetical protein